MSKIPLDMKKTVENLLRAPYPFDHEHNKTIYQQCGRMFHSQKNLYLCNFCKIKLLGEAELLEHNKSFGHQAEMEKQIAEMLKKSTLDKKVPCIKLSKTAKEQLGKAAIQASKMKLDEAMAELKNEYELYRLHPSLHPMYSKEWQVFYLRRSSELLAKNIDPGSYDFTRDWSSYWVQRIQVYYNKSLQKTINTIGTNYRLTLHETDEIKSSQATNGQHSNGVHDDANDDTHTNGNLTNSFSSNSDNSNDHSNIDTFSIANDETVSNGKNDNGNDNDNDNDKVIVIDSDAVTEDDASDCDMESDAKNRSKSNNESESDTESEDGLRSGFGLSMPQHLIDEARALINSSGENSQEVKTDIKEDTTKESIYTAKDSDAIADSVLSFFQSCGLNPANLSDEQVQQYIEFIVKSTSKPTNDRAGSVETTHSSDSNDESYRYT